MGIFKKDLNSGGEAGFGCGKAVGANRYSIAYRQGVIELGYGTAVDCHGLELEPSADLLLFFLWPSGEHLVEQWSGLRNEERLGHGGILAEKSLQGNVWRLVEKGGRGRVWG